MANDEKQPPAERRPEGKDPQIKSLDQVLDKRPVEIGGPKGPEPTRYGDWERKGRCIDF